ncbi:MAG TPA: hypothetical protein VFV52_13360 [Bacilli bacterium]|nr:hypothetical protein [Bacilli bacterium]
MIQTRAEMRHRAEKDLADAPFPLGMKHFHEDNKRLVRKELGKE